MDIKSGLTGGLKKAWRSILVREEVVPINTHTFRGLQPNTPAKLCIDVIPKEGQGAIRLWMEVTHEACALDEARAHAMISECSAAAGPPEYWQVTRHANMQRRSR